MSLIPKILIKKDKIIHKQQWKTIAFLPIAFIILVDAIA